MKLPTAHWALSRPLEQLAVELTVYCNLQCKMCSVWELREHGVPTDIAKQMLSDSYALGARVLHIEDTHPRDPFRCEVRTLEPTYDSYVRNAIHFMDKYPEDGVLAARVRADLRWYERDEARGCWVKNGHANDIEHVLAHERRERAEQTT